MLASDYLAIVKDLLISRKKKVFLVGGALRDFVLESPCLDFDFTVSSEAIPLARQFAKKIKGAFILLDQEHGCARVARKEQGQLLTFDFADYRAKTLRADLLHRD